MSVNKDDMPHYNVATGRNEIQIPHFGVSRRFWDAVNTAAAMSFHQWLKVIAVYDLHGREIVSMAKVR